MIGVIKMKNKRLKDGETIARVKDNINSFIPSIVLRKRIRAIHSRISRRIAKGKRIRVVFFLQYPEMWNSEKTVYLSMKNTATIDSIVLCIPKRKRDTGMFEEKNAAFQFCNENGIRAIDAYEDRKWKAIEADYIFLQRPYDSDMPECYQMEELSKKSLLCYIPYGFEFAKGIHWDIEYNTSANQHLYMIFADNRCSHNYVIKKNITSLVIGARRVYDIGYPRFDLIAHCMENNKCKTFLWLPRWSVDDSNDKSTFVDYYEHLVEFFEKDNSIELIIRPHPLMFENFIKCGLYSKEQVDQIINRVNMISNITWDNNTDYLKTFDESDCLIADFTSLIIEYYVTGKPIIYCGKSESFNEIGKEIEKSFYKVGGWEDLKKGICIIRDSGKVIEKGNNSFVRDYCVGDVIVDIVLCDAFNNRLKQGKNASKIN